MAAGEDVVGSKEDSLTFSLDQFAELDEVTAIIESIGSICHEEILLEAATERLVG